MQNINQEHFRKTSNKVGLFYICEILSLILIIPVLTQLGIYNSSNSFIFNLSIILIASCLFFPCDFINMFLGKNKINDIEGILYVFIFLSIYFPLAIVSMVIAFILYIIAKKKNYPEIKNMRISKIKKIIPSN